MCKNSAVLSLVFFCAFYTVERPTCTAEQPTNIFVLEIQKENNRWRQLCGKRAQNVTLSSFDHREECSP